MGDVNPNSVKVHKYKLMCIIQNICSFSSSTDNLVYVIILILFAATSKCFVELNNDEYIDDEGLHYEDDLTDLESGSIYSDYESRDGACSVRYSYYYNYRSSSTISIRVNYNTIQRCVKYFNYFFACSLKLIISMLQSSLGFHCYDSSQYTSSQSSSILLQSEISEEEQMLLLEVQRRRQQDFGQHDIISSHETKGELFDSLSTISQASDDHLPIVECSSTSKEVKKDRLGLSSQVCNITTAKDEGRIIKTGEKSNEPCYEYMFMQAVHTKD